MAAAHWPTEHANGFGLGTLNMQADSDWEGTTKGDAKKAVCSTHMV